MCPERLALLSTVRPEALKSFVEGREQFNIYLGNGRSTELEKASQLFKEAASLDPEFDLASFYHALARTELRDSNNAIRELQRLIGKRVNFLPDAYLHLAYAYTKTYRDAELYQADVSLDQALAEAKRTGEGALKPIIKAYRVFLYSVMGGRLKEASAETKRAYINKAIWLGKWNLLKRLWRRDERSALLIKLELHNALGIAYMRKGEVSEPFSKSQEKWWRLASKHFETALKLGLNPVRVRQNIGTLLGIQGQQYQKRNKAGDRQRAEEFFQKAVTEHETSIALNPLDQFPHYELAKLHVRLAQWDSARKHLAQGRQQNGAVEPASWERIEEAIALRDPSLLNR